MNVAYKGKTKVHLNGKFMGYASHVGIDRQAGQVIVSITINNDIKNDQGKIVSKEDNYQAFFNKFAKAFSKK